MPATLPTKKRPPAKKMAARRAPQPKAKAANAGAACRPRQLSGKQILSDKAADFFNAFLD